MTKQWMILNYYQDKKELREYIKNLFKIFIKVIGSVNGIEMIDDVESSDEEQEDTPDIGLYEELKNSKFSIEEIQEIVSKKDFEMYEKYLKKGIKGFTNG